MAATDFTQLETEVTELTSVIDSAVTLIQGFAAEILQHAGDEAKVRELAQGFDAQAQRLAEAVAANTPADDGGTV